MQHTQICHFLHKINIWGFYLFKQLTLLHRDLNRQAYQEVWGHLLYFCSWQKFQLEQACPVHFN